MTNLNLRELLAFFAIYVVAALFFLIGHGSLLFLLTSDTSPRSVTRPESLNRET